MAFSDDRHGWVVGENGLVMTTADAGVHWQRQRSGFGLDLNAVIFLTPMRGWAVGEKGTVLATSDGGVTWTTQITGTSWAL